MERDKLWKVLRNIRLNKKIKGRIQEIYKKVTAIRSGEDITEKFWMTKEVRQSYVLNPLLFNLYIADLDRELKTKDIESLYSVRQI